MISDDAQKVIDYLKVHGWIQNNFKDNVGRVCLAKAITSALGHVEGDPLRWKLNELLGHKKHESDPRYSIIRFNDAGSTTLEDIFNLLERAKETDEVAPSAT